MQHRLSIRAILLVVGAGVAIVALLDLLSRAAWRLLRAQWVGHLLLLLHLLHHLHLVHLLELLHLLHLLHVLYLLLVLHVFHEVLPLLCRHTLHLLLYGMHLLWLQRQQDLFKALNWTLHATLLILDAS